ncbi:head-tail connector protein [Magnetospirillum molischianum]|uniref:Phage gp6-like head-tail connector protein n=1 Tax=Magnetospirillum molischianum DSM 120 TaxID=1150626 RepID=H8FUZ1_MAGML|nr:head-tail connector protein [Magnetospirillum molischianum]CCG42179.1 conserved hypothetical protein [Magnetospirillum molischianum DSM 120]
MSLILVTGPVALAVPLEVVKSHLQLMEGEDADDGLISGYVRAAVDLVEGFTERALIERTLRLVLDHWPSGPVVLPRPPLIAVERVAWIDPDGAEQVVTPPLAYQVSRREPAILAPSPGQSWPATRRQLDAVSIEYRAGYGATADAVPEAIRHAILLLVAQWYAVREPVSIGNIVNVLPFAVEALLGPYRVWSVA